MGQKNFQEREQKIKIRYPVQTNQYDFYSHIGLFVQGITEITLKLFTFYLYLKYTLSRRKIKNTTLLRNYSLRNLCFCTIILPINSH